MATKMHIWENSQWAANWKRWKLTWKHGPMAFNVQLKTVYQGKFWFLTFSWKCSWPIRYEYSLILWPGQDENAWCGIIALHTWRCWCFGMCLQHTTAIYDVQWRVVMYILAVSVRTEELSLERTGKGEKWSVKTSSSISLEWRILVNLLNICAGFLNVYRHYRAYSRHWGHLCDIQLNRERNSENGLIFTERHKTEGF